MYHYTDRDDFIPSEVQRNSIKYLFLSPSFHPMICPSTRLHFSRVEQQLFHLRMMCYSFSDRHVTMLIYACLVNLYSLVYIQDPVCVRPLCLMYTWLTRLKRCV